MMQNKLQRNKTRKRAEWKYYFHTVTFKRGEVTKSTTGIARAKGGLDIHSLIKDARKAFNEQDGLIKFNEIDKETFELWKKEGDNG